MSRITLEWAYEGTYDTGYGEVGAEYQVTALVRLDGLKAMQVESLEVWVSYMDQSETERFFEYVAGALKYYKALEEEALERAERSIDSQDIAEAKADTWLKSNKEDF